MRSSDEIMKRVNDGQTFMSRFSRRDRAYCQRFRDPSKNGGVVPDMYSDAQNAELGGEQIDLPEGVTNQLASNVLTKAASVALMAPDFQIQTHSHDPEKAQVVRDVLLTSWERSNWTRLSWRPLMKMCICGLGALAYLWSDSRRTVFRHLHSWDLFIDPAASSFDTDHFDDVRYAGYRIRIPVETAIERYGKEPFSAEKDSIIDLWLYYDREEEVHIYNNNVVFRDANHYSAIPILFYEGNPDPNPTILPIGDYQFALGLQTKINDMNQVIQNRAIHGGPINLIQENQFEEGGKDALLKGREQGYVGVKDIMNPPVHRIPGEELSPTLLAARQELEQGMDAITGTTQYERGVLTNGAKFATEAAMLQRNSGARRTQSRVEFERFVKRMLFAVVKMESLFGGPQEGMNQSDMQLSYAVWQAFKDVDNITVIEGSTEFKDEVTEIQQTLQAIPVCFQAVPICLQLGLPIPNITEVMNDLWRSFRRSNIQRYWLPNPQGGAGMQGQMPPHGGEMDEPPQQEGGIL